MRKLSTLWAKITDPLRRFWRWYKALYHGTPWWKRTLAVIGTFFAFILFYIFAVQFNLLWLFGKSPSLSSIIHPRNATASEIYSADGKVLGKLFSENRQPVDYKDIAPAFIDALISTEDERFYEHNGIDYRGMVSAAKDAAQGHARGASTITQQLVKNMFRVRTQYSTGLLGYIPGVKILIMKSKEMIIARELELFCSKEEILQMYCNTVDFGSNAYGIKTAAKTYFSCAPRDLKVEECAVLVGLLKATSAYNPRLNPQRSLERRNVVLENMCSHGKLTRAQCDSLKALPIDLKYNVETTYDGSALYFRQYVAKFIKENITDDEGEPLLDPYTDGLKIYTTVDSRMQEYAEAAVKEQMERVQRNFKSHWGSQDPWITDDGKPIPGFIEEKLRQTEAYKILTAKYPDQPSLVRSLLNEPHRVKLFDYDGGHYATMSSVDSLRYMLHYMHTGFIAMEPETGDVKAYVGDVDFATWKYDNASAAHQPGSTFKLFVYATAMKQGLLPSTCRRDEHISMKVLDKHGKETTWQPHNADGRFTGADMPLRAAFARSINTIAVKLGQEVGISNVIETAHEMGIKSELENAPALALGSSDVNLMELVNAYCTVANYGVHVEPTVITKIVDMDGKVIYEAPRESNRVLTEMEAFYMQKLLEASARDAGGTSMSFGGYVGQWYPQIAYGGKTGTSNSHADAWFVGVLPRLVGGAWVGGEYRQIHFRTGALGQGSRTALPIVGAFMQRVLQDSSLRSRYLGTYRKPEGVDPSSYEGSYTEVSRDTTYSDSTAVAPEEIEDLMGGDESAEPTTPAPQQPQQRQPQHATPPEHNGGEDLFE